MKFHKNFKVLSLVLLFIFLLDILSPAALMAANFSKKGKYRLNSYTPAPIPKQPAIKSQRSLVNKILEENVEKPPRTAFYKNGRLLFAREYPELAKRPGTKKELKKYQEGNFYPSPVPANRTYIPYTHGGVPPEPFKNPPAGVPVTSPQTMFPSDFNFGFLNKKWLLAFNDYGNFPLGIPEDRDSLLISQNAGSSDREFT